MNLKKMNQIEVMMRQIQSTTRALRRNLKSLNDMEKLNQTKAMETILSQEVDKIELLATIITLQNVEHDWKKHKKYREEEKIQYAVYNANAEAGEYVHN